ncbi:MAG: hypothetical protein V4636_13025 [Pseudomonadota bacterium]
MLTLTNDYEQRLIIGRVRSLWTARHSGDQYQRRNVRQLLRFTIRDLREHRARFGVIDRFAEVRNPAFVSCWENA